MIFIAICDDCKDDLMKTQKIVKSYFDKKFLLYKINIYQSGLNLLNSNINFDLVLLDIKLKGLNGIQTGRKIRLKNINTKIIYTIRYEST